MHPEGQRHLMVGEAVSGGSIEGIAAL